jgi:hypothetical protein
MMRYEQEILKVKSIELDRVFPTQFDGVFWDLIGTIKSSLSSSRSD